VTWCARNKRGLVQRLAEGGAKDVVGPRMLWVVVEEEEAARQEARARRRCAARPWERFDEKHWSAHCWGVVV
jgi:hypothetical protein